MTASVITWTHLTDIAQVVTAVGAIVIPGVIAWSSYARRPSVSLIEDPYRIQSRNEGADRQWPHVRLLACNKGLRRAARGTRVVVEGYRRQGEPRDKMTTLGSPLLGWPSSPASAESGEISLFPGARRPIDLGFLVPVDPETHAAAPLVAEHNGNQIVLLTPLDQGGEWYFRLGLAFDLSIADNRDFIPPGRWVITLTIGADDGSARTYDVDLAWSRTGTPEAALTSALDHLAVRAV
jgi:hypothetical protein